LLAVDDEGRIRFGQCQCQFFKDNIMSRGPCEHILAVRSAYDQHVRQNQEAAIDA
jgi:predicted nucleic acid-binding Zn finger protein